MENRQINRLRMNQEAIDEKVLSIALYFPSYSRAAFSFTVVTYGFANEYRFNLKAFLKNQLELNNNNNW